MATTSKKKVTKTSAAKAKRAPSVKTKSTVTRVKAAPTKRASVKKTSHHSEFLTLRLTRETLHWIALGVVVIGFSVWVMMLTVRVQNLYDQIIIDNANSALIIPKKSAATP